MGSVRDRLPTVFAPPSYPHPFLLQEFRKAVSSLGKESGKPPEFGENDLGQCVLPDIVVIVADASHALVVGAEEVSDRYFVCAFVEPHPLPQSAQIEEIRENALFPPDS